MKTEDRFSEDRRIKSLAKKLAKGAWPKLDEMARQSFLAKAKITISLQSVRTARSPRAGLAFPDSNPGATRTPTRTTNQGT